MPAKVNVEVCGGCGTCVDGCPVGAIKLDKKTGKAVVKEDDCIECGACEGACPCGAIKVE